MINQMLMKALDQSKLRPRLNVEYAIKRLLLKQQLGHMRGFINQKDNLAAMYVIQSLINNLTWKWLVFIAFQVCGKTFITNRNLIYHTKIHKEKSHKCQFCDKKFSCSGNLKDHIRRHVGFRPFQCTICLERYFVMKHVRAHFLKRHPDMNVAKNVKKILQHNSSAI